MRLKTNHFTGNGTAQSVTGLGFQPDWVILKATLQVGVIRTSTMATDSAKPLTGNTAVATGVITSLDADGFTVGADARSNGNGVVIRWFAGLIETGFCAVGTYTGNATDNRTITCGFVPDVELVFDAAAVALFYRTSSVPAEVSSTDLTSQKLDAIQVSNAIQKEDATNGFQIGNAASTVNTNTNTYHWLAFKAKSGQVAVLPYTGNGTSLGVTGAGFTPQAVLTKVGAATSTAGIRLDHTSTSSGLANASADVTTLITSLDADGFTVGSSASGNTNASTYYAVAFGPDVAPSTGGATRMALLGVG